MLPVTQIDIFHNGLTLRHRDTINAAAGGTFMRRRPEECYDLIKNMTADHNDWDTSVQRSESSSSITSSFDSEIVALKAEMAEINKNLMKVLQINQQVKAVTHKCETCGGPHSYNDCPSTVGQTQNVYAAGANNQGGNSYHPQGYKMIIEDMYEEQAKADFDAWHVPPEVNPLPFEKQLSFVYTQAIFKKFQVEVLGVAACHLKIEEEDGSSITHTIVVLQILGVFTIPVKYVLQRWTNAGASRVPLSEKLENVQMKIRRLNDLCHRAVIVGEEGSISQEL
nr:hypothetical protein [Tanacetum cinerariifolium]